MALAFSQPLSIATAPDRSVEETWHAESEHGDQAQIEHDFPTAEKFYRQALVTAAPLGPTSKQVLTTTARLGTILVLRGHFDQAEPYFLQSLTMVKNLRKAGTPDAETLTWFDDFSDAYQQIGQKLKLKNMYCLEHCISLRTAIAPDTHSKLGAACAELASLYIQAGRFTEAEALFNTQIACINNKFGAKSGLYMPLANLALVQEKQKKYSEAETNLTKALALMTQSGVAPVFIEMHRKDLQRIQAESHKSQAK